jgi:hypothetical protein
MAALSPAEFREAVGILVEAMGLQRLRDRLASYGAFRNRRGLNSTAEIADRLYQLSGSLRLRVPATFAFTTLWGETITGGFDEAKEKELEGLAEGVNACLGPSEAIVAGKEADLDTALAAYRAKLIELIGPARARLDMLLKAVPAVAERLRAGESGGTTAS